jgi:hypothetical protein
MAMLYSYFLGWSEAESTITERTKWPIVPALDDDDDECGPIGAMSGRGNVSPQRKPVPVPFCLMLSYVNSNCFLCLLLCKKMMPFNVRLI